MAETTVMAAHYTHSGEAEQEGTHSNKTLHGTVSLRISNNHVDRGEDDEWTTWSTWHHLGCPLTAETFFRPLG